MNELIPSFKDTLFPETYSVISDSLDFCIDSVFDEALNGFPIVSQYILKQELKASKQFLSL